MRIYELHLESGPQRKTTMVHVLALPGCVANGRTTDEALAATPDAIRAYLRWSKRIGEPADPDEPFRTRIVEHVTKGQFLGQGGAVFEADRRPLTPKDLERYLRRAEWSRADLLALTGDVDGRALRARPTQGGRSLHEILLHVLGADKGYVYAVAGPVKELGAATSAADRGALDLREALARCRELAVDALRRMPAARRREVWAAGRSTRTARRALRRMLEHEWEHRREIAARLGRDA